MRIVKLDAESPLLQAVIALGDQHKQYLGFFPGEAFRKAAAKGLIFVALDDAGVLGGYVLYYIAYSRVVLQHLCVNPLSQKKGTARALVEHLKRITIHCDGISLHCRRNFPAHSLWPKLGFHAIDEKPGRGKAAETLTRFWMDFGHPDLMSSMTAALAKSKHVVVLDANVVFDLQSADGAKANQSEALEGGWLCESIALWVTDEIFNEIDRNNDPTERRRAKHFARSLPKVTVDPQRRDRVVTELTAMFATANSVQDESDRRQLACAIAADAPFFVTRDAALLRRSDDIWRCFGIRVVQPIDLVLHFDELQRQADYEPSRLAGTAIQARKVAAEDVSGLANVFLDCGGGEKKTHFNDILRGVLLDPRQHDSLLIRGEDRCLALIALKTDAHAVSIPLFRVAPGVLAGTLARNLSLRALTISLSKDRPLTIVTDEHLSSAVVEALREVGFAVLDGKWAKAHLTGIASPELLAAQASALAAKASLNSRLLTATAEDIRALAGNDGTGEAVAQVERRIWPGKVDDTNVRNYVVPIQPRWAQHLFDEAMANQCLFGAVPSLALNCEHVYYRGARPRVLQAPGRILWYVSEDRAYAGTKAIRACSTLDEVVVGPAKSLFRRFQRLGVFEWRDVLAIAGGDPDQPLMAVRFGITETLKSPIGPDRFAEILRRHGRPIPPLSTAYSLSPECFREIYRLGVGITDTA